MDGCGPFGMFESSDLDFPSDGPPPPAAALQLALEDQRRSPLAAPTPGAEAGGGFSLASTVRGLPRAKKVDGRFEIDEKDFPGYRSFGFRDFIRWQRSVPKMETFAEGELERALPVHTPDFPAIEAPPRDKIQATWLGHSSVLVQWHGWNVLADPIFSKRCSPSQWVGPARLRPTPCGAGDLPKVDAVVISHNHYDHLDYGSVRELARRSPPPIWFVPLGMKGWLGRAGVRNVVEMDWSEAVALRDDGDRPDLVVSCVPVQHWCKRAPGEVNAGLNQCLWSGWACHSAGTGYFFGGDTGYAGPMFRRIGEALGPFRLAAIPIGAGGSEVERWFHAPNHQSPEEAVAMAVDIRAEHSIGVHWGTFQLTYEPFLSPPKRMAVERDRLGLPRDSFVAMHHGETRSWLLR